MSASTSIHRWVAQCRAGSLESCVARCPSGWVIMGMQQVFEGYCLLLPDPVVPDLNALDAAARTLFLSDMSALGDVLLTVCGAVRINYAIFGNVEPALHAHVFPRRADEPAGTRTAQPWALDWKAAPVFAAAVHGDLKRRIATALLQR